MMLVARVATAAYAMLSRSCKVLINIISSYLKARRFLMPRISYEPGDGMIN